MKAHTIVPMPIPHSIKLFITSKNPLALNGDKSIMQRIIATTRLPQSYIVFILIYRKKKYNYWTNEKNDYTNPAQWMSDAVEHAGSWWLDWFDWMAKQSEEMIPARKILDGIYDAPGKYVVNELPEDIGKDNK